MNEQSVMVPLFYQLLSYNFLTQRNTISLYKTEIQNISQIISFTRFTLIITSLTQR